MDLMGAAQELSGLLPAEFVPRRNVLAKEAKDDGDKELSEQVKKLAKPSTAAWVVNMLVRHEPEQVEHVEQILELGAALREAQESMARDQDGRDEREEAVEAARKATDQERRVPDTLRPWRPVNPVRVSPGLVSTQLRRGTPLAP